MDTNIVLIGIFLLVLILVGAVVAAINVMGSPRKIVRRRIEKLRQKHSMRPEIKSSAARAIKIGTDAATIEQILRQMLPRREELQARLDRTGRKISLTRYALFSVVLAIVVALILVIVVGAQFLLALLVGTMVGLLLPHLAISRMMKKRMLTFNHIFPDAIELMVRGLKSGLPVTETIKNCGTEIDDPVGIEFRSMSDNIRLGKTLDEALWDAAKVLDTPDFKFFVISLSVQKETGGNLAETLSNLADILRKRLQMKLKIKAMSAEGRASAIIVGSLPFVMFGIILSMNYKYGSILFTDPRAIIVSIGAMIWMSIGIFIMSRMINFEI
jgi:tight adherence protein B